MVPTMSDVATRAARTGACYSFGLDSGAVPELRALDWYVVRSSEWLLERPNPLPAFSRPDEVYSPVFLPSSYWPLRLPPPEESEGVRFYPIASLETGRMFEAIQLHEAIHQTLVSNGITPTLMRLAAARAYGLLACMLNESPVPPVVWRLFEGYNALIERLFLATAPVHEAVANVLTLSRLVGNNPSAMIVSRGSSATYAKIYEGFFDVCLLLANANNILIERFPSVTGALLLLAEYAISSAVSLDEIRADILSGPGIITDVDAFLGNVGIPYGLKHQHLLYEELASPRYRIADVTERFADALVSVEAAPPPHGWVETEVDQVRYLAANVPALHNWLAESKVRRWLRERLLDAIRQWEQWLGSVGFPLAMLEAWETGVSTLHALRIDSAAEVPRSVVLGEHVDEEYASLLRSLPQERYFAYLGRKDRPACAFGVACRGGDPNMPLHPQTWMLAPFGKTHGGQLERMTGGIVRLVLFEGLRQQLAAGCGVSCPLLRSDGSCCGAMGVLRKVYEVGCRATQEAGWRPPCWIEPTC